MTISAEPTVGQTSTLDAPSQSVKAGRQQPLFAWHRLGLGVLLVLAAGLNFWALNINGWSNEYYASAIQSMSQSWSNFFFGAFDPGGFITVDKPPAAFWIETISVKIFGYNSWGILIPSAAAGTGAVALLYFLVARYFGVVAGLSAALLLALTPISVVMNRHNNPDSLLVFFLVAAVAAISLAIEKGKLGWLLGAIALVGFAFNIKMLVAFLILPAMYLAYFLFAKAGWWRKIINLSAATVLLVVISLSWAVIVDLIPADSRPYVGGSDNNSVIQLLVSYNGLERVAGNSEAPGGANFPGGMELPAGFDPSSGEFPFPVEGQNGNFPPPTGTNGTFTPPQGAQVMPIGGGNRLMGSDSATRLFESELAGEYAWFLPLALLGLGAGSWLAWRGYKGDERRLRLAGITLWGGWLVVTLVVFSFSKGIFHSYYLNLEGPAVAGMAGIGMGAAWQMFKGKGFWLLPLGLLGTAAWQVYLVQSYPSWSTLGYVGAGITTAAAVGLVITRFMPVASTLKGKVTAAMLTMGLVALVLVPGGWSVAATQSSIGGSLPTAIPNSSNVAIGMGRPGGMGDGTYNAGLVSYLQANRNGAKYLLAVGSSMQANSIIINTGEAVMAMGGFSGGDKSMTVAQLAQKVANNEVRYFMVQGAGGMAGPGNFGGNSELNSWVTSNCTLVDTSAYSTGSASSNTGSVNNPFGQGGSLYQCQPAA